MLEINLHSITGTLMQTQMFQDATDFDQDIGNWDVSSGLDFVSLGRILSHRHYCLGCFIIYQTNWHSITGSLMQTQMFDNATNFNQNINGWDVSSGLDFVSFDMILSRCSFFLDVSVNSNTDTMLCCLQASMFANATAFNQDINSWDVSKGTNFVSSGRILLMFHSYLICL